jgi:hypothetical protein
VYVTGVGTYVIGDVGEESDYDVLNLFFVFAYTGYIEVGLSDYIFGGFPGYTAQFGPGFYRRQFNVEPLAVFVFLAPQGFHLGEIVSFYHKIPNEF